MVNKIMMVGLAALCSSGLSAMLVEKKIKIAVERNESSKTATVLLRDEASKVVGSIWYCLNRNDSAYISKFFVDNAYQKCGLGKKLAMLAVADIIAQQPKVKTLGWWSLSSGYMTQEELDDFYKNFGAVLEKKSDPLSSAVVSLAQVVIAVNKFLYSMCKGFRGGVFAAICGVILHRDFRLADCGEVVVLQAAALLSFLEIVRGEWHAFELDMEKLKNKTSFIDFKKLAGMVRNGAEFTCPLFVDAEPRFDVDFEGNMTIHSRL